MSISNSNAAHREIGTSLNKVDGLIAIGANIAVIHHISKRLEIFDQTIFAIRSPVSQRKAAIIFTNSSGIDVPIAKIVIQMIIGCMLNLFAIA